MRTAVSLHVRSLSMAFALCVALPAASAAQEEPVRMAVRIDVSGGADPAWVRRVVRPRRPALRYCIENSMFSLPAAGTATVRMRVDALGRVIDTLVVAGAGLTESVRECLERSTRIRFPPAGSEALVHLHLDYVNPAGQSGPTRTQEADAALEQARAARERSRECLQIANRVTVLARALRNVRDRRRVASLRERLADQQRQLAMVCELMTAGGLEMVGESAGSIGGP